MPPVGTRLVNELSRLRVGDVPGRALQEAIADLAGVDQGDLIVVVVAVGRFRARPARIAGRPEVLAGTAVPATADPRTGDGCARTGASGWASLTERERAVATLAGRALTNQQIAHRLRISPHTVNFHLRQIFKKLGIESRVRLARAAEDEATHGDDSVHNGR